MHVQTFGIRAFRFRFVQAGQVFGEAMGMPLPPDPDLNPIRMVAGVRRERVLVPSTVPQFDTLWIDCLEMPGSELSTGPPGIGAVTPQK